MKTFLYLVLSALMTACGAGVAFAQQAPPAKQAAVTAESVQRDIESTHTLIEKSKSAAQIDSSNSAESKSKREDARGLLKQAVQASAASDLLKASALLTEAKKKMFEAVRLANPEQVHGNKAEQDYKKRLETVKVLRNSIASLGGAKNADVVKRVDAAIAESEQLAGAGKHAEALGALNKGYDAVKTANIEQRDKTEQFASKTFPTKEDEYKYELARNQDYAGLTLGVMESMDPKMAGLYKGTVEKASALRRDAEGMAGRKEFDGGVKALEQSTAEYKKVVRAAGIPVP